MKFLDQLLHRQPEDEEQTDETNASSDSDSDDEYTSFTHSEAADPYSRNTNKVIAQGRSLPLQALIQELLLQGVSEKDLHREKDTDSPEIIRLKRKLVSTLSLNKKTKRKSHNLDENTYENKSAHHIKETAKTIRRFMDFDHNRDRDGRQSLGEHKGNRSTFEKKLIAATAVASVSAVERMVGADVTHDFTSGLHDKISQTKDALMGEMKDHLAERALKSTMPSSVKTFAEIGQAIASAAEHNINAHHSPAEESPQVGHNQRSHHHDASVRFMSEGTLADIEHPDKTPNEPEIGFQQRILNSKGFEGRGL
ncbi:MAG: hypothetical protein MK137_08185 [Rickettsiales bacterium]|nr:hypothetical protein [Rickettsiales bacterium]